MHKLLFILSNPATLELLSHRIIHHDISEGLILSLETNSMQLHRYLLAIADSLRRVHLCKLVDNTTKLLSFHFIASTFIKKNTAKHLKLPEITRSIKLHYYIIASIYGKVKNIKQQFCGEEELRTRPRERWKQPISTNLCKEHLTDQ